MLKQDDSLENLDAGQVRVSAKDLTEALASLDIRKARQDYEQIGTVTLAEGITGCSIEATPEELQSEIEKIREADRVQEDAARRHRRLQLALVSEAWSAALCLLVVLGLHQTLFNKGWQKSYQARVVQHQQASQQEDFQQKLQQSMGPNPKYQVVNTSGNIRSGTSSSAYPFYCFPDGCNLRGYWGRDDNKGDFLEMGGFTPFSEGSFEFQPMNAMFYHDNITVYYNGHAYWRGWVHKQEVPQMLQGKSFMFFAASAGNAQFRQPQYHLGDIRQVTLAVEDIESSRGQEMFSDIGNMVSLPDGQHVHLDKHAWEAF